MKQTTYSTTLRTEITPVAFDLIDQKAEEVYIIGSFNDWKIGATQMTPLGEGMWGARLALPPGRYEYQFVVDGKRTHDPSADETVANADGGLNSVLVVLRDRI